MASPLDAALGAGSAVGRYFTAVSVLPSALLVMYVWLLAAAGALSATVEPSGVLEAVRSLQIQDLAWFAGASVLTALALHPLQFVMTQLLEGYWGTSTIGLRLARHGIMRHRRRALWAEGAAVTAHRDLALHGSAIFNGEDVVPAWATLDEDERQRRALEARDLLEEEGGSQVLHLHILKEAALKARDEYPVEIERCMPTRLGNILRRYEDKSGKQYRINTIAVAPHLSLVAKPEHYSYVRDRQKVLDLAVSLCAVATLATVVTVVGLANDGPWVVAGLLPFGFAYLAYLGAIGAATGYCVAIETVTDLSRFQLYDALHLPLPGSLAEERVLASSMIRMLTGHEVDGTLRHPSPEQFDTARAATVEQGQESA